MGKWFRQILQGEHSLFRLSLPFRVRLFNVLALVGGMISLINGISSYANNQDSVILGLNLGIAVLSFVLLFYAYKSGRYQFCYVVTIITIFLVMFPYLFFKSGGYKGGMVSFYIFGILFTVFMLEGKVMFFTAFTGGAGLYFAKGVLGDTAYYAQFANFMSVTQMISLFIAFVILYFITWFYLFIVKLIYQKFLKAD